jgi:tRNA modification GTPase
LSFLPLAENPNHPLLRMVIDSPFANVQNMKIDTIAAIATPAGKGGIGVVRLSGPEAISVAKRLFAHKDGSLIFGEGRDRKRIVSHQLRLGYICDPESGYVIDEVLLCVMKAPQSYTREDVVEIQCHAGLGVLSKILCAVLDAGARLAEPGEFTKRAFLNGRIDLSQAEAIAEMISAKSEAGVQLAASHLTGGLKTAVHGFIDALTEIQVEMEARIEFPDDVNPSIDKQRVSTILEDCVIKPIEALVRQYEEGRVYRDGLRIDIVGRPNVGKSSLLNSLIQKEKAIVTAIPGTTRDLVEDHIIISGVPVQITDTAGLHRTEDPIEVIGMQKTREHLMQSDLVLWVVDGEQGITGDDQIIFGQIEGRNIVLVVNKLDLLHGKDEIYVPEALRSIDRIFVSAKYGQGIDRLKEAIRDKFMSDIDIDPGLSVVPNLRQKSALDAAIDFLRQAAKGILRDHHEEMIVSDVLAAKNALGVIIGDRVDEDVLDGIFGKFCIGK